MMFEEEDRLQLHAEGGEEDQDQQLSTSPKTVVDATSLFLSRKTPSSIVPVAVEKKLSLEGFISGLPNAIQERKLHSIQPGAFNDPICHLFRYVK